MDALNCNRVLIKQVAEYLTMYLPQFMKGEDIDRVGFLDRKGQAVDAPTLEDVGPVLSVDLELHRFGEIFSQIPSARLSDFHVCASSLEHLIVADIGSWFGENFGLWVAHYNKQAQVNIFDPVIPKRFPNFVLSMFPAPYIAGALKLPPPGDAECSEQAINTLFQVNGFGNVRFHQEAVNFKMLDRLAKENPTSCVLYFAYRPVHEPIDLTYVIGNAAANNPNSHMIIVPHIRGNICAYQDDPLIQLINRYHKISHKQEQTGVLAEDTLRTRIFAMMQLYYALKAAITSGKNAQIYKENDLTKYSVFHKPLFYVSTVPAA